MKIGDIEVQNVRDLQKILSKKYTTNGTNNMMNHLKNILKDALNEHAIDMNPCDFVNPLKRVEVEARDTIHRALTVEETKKFFEVATESWYYNVFCFMINTGMRLGEVGRLTLADIKKDKVEVRSTIQQSSLGLIIGKDTKSRSGIRDIPMTDGIRKAVENQKLQNNFAFSDRVVDINKPLFTSSGGTFLSASAVDRNINYYCKKAGIEKFTSHAFRDTFATRAFESGMQPKTLQEILGHSNIGITMNLYAHVMQETKVAEMNAVSIMI